MWSFLRLSTDNRSIHPGLSCTQLKPDHFELVKKQEEKLKQPAFIISLDSHLKISVSQVYMGTRGPSTFKKVLFSSLTAMLSVTPHAGLELGIRRMTELCLSAVTLP